MLSCGRVWTRCSMALTVSASSGRALRQTTVDARRGMRRSARPIGQFVHFLSFVQTRSMSCVAASGQAGVNAILMSDGTFNSGASFMAGS